MSPSGLSSEGFDQPSLSTKTRINNNPNKGAKRSPVVQYLLDAWSQ